MTKDEALDRLIEYRRKGSSVPLYKFCDTIVYCSECPFSDDNDKCSEAMIVGLIDRFIKAEESQKAETNLKHYIDIEYMDDDVFCANLKASAIEDFNKSDSDDFYKWLLAPYEEPKPKYKLSKFEHDLLQVSINKWERIIGYAITDSDTLEKMADKGYFKNIPLTIPIKDILANCEVVEE